MNEDMQSRIDRLAIRFTEAVSEEKRWTLKTAIVEACLRMKLKVSETVDLNDAILNSGNSVDTFVLNNTVNEALAKYDSGKGSFSHFFNYLYKLRYNDEAKKANNYGGIRNGRDAVGEKLCSEFNRSYRCLGIREKLELEHDSLQTMNAEEIRRVGKYLGYDEASISRLQGYGSESQLNICSTNVQYDDGAEKNISDSGMYLQWTSLGDESSLEKYEEIRDLLELVIAEATEAQKKYFRAFISQRLYNTDSYDKLKLCRELLEHELIMQAVSNNKDSINDVMLAQYLGVGKAAISKQKAKFNKAMQAVRNREL